jgi:hypothetical protein
MISHKASQEDLEPLIEKFAGTGRKAKSFRLICKYCRDMGTVSATSQTITTTKYLRKAAEKFSMQGWVLDRKTPVCPKCNKKHLSSTNQTDAKTLNGPCLSEASWSATP